MVQLLNTKLFIPSRPKIVPRPRLVERLNRGLRSPSGVALISAPAGFGKTTLLSEWIAGCGQPVAWLSLDEGDSDPRRFLTYFIAALQTIAADTGAGWLESLQTPLPPSTEWVLTGLLNEISAIPQDFVFVLSWGSAELCYKVAGCI